MPIFVAALLGGLVNIAATLAGRVLIALGVGFVTYTGLSTSLDFFKNQAVQSLAGLPVEMISLIAFMGVGEAISIIVSALAIKMTLAGLTGGGIKKMVYR